MSTTIDIYPTTGRLPLVEQTRARTQELFQALLNRYEVNSQIDVRAFWPHVEPGQMRFLDEGVRWGPGLEVGFSYWIDGELDSLSWPSCCVFDEDEDRIAQDDLRGPMQLNGAPPELLGMWGIADDLVRTVSLDTLAAISNVAHYWSEYRNAAGPAVASTGYGLTAAALAEATDGVIASFDCAFCDVEDEDGIDHNGESAEQFLAWWGDRQFRFYGADSFRTARQLQQHVDGKPSE